MADPESCTVHAYRSPVEVRELRSEDNLSGDDVLPGFAVSVADLFRE
ncbi:MAG: hypothetical protein HYX75_07625 [Acidobacteria bacterium]|nr:hypothetical protein [Acidobacteriota bacterium]